MNRTIKNPLLKYFLIDDIEDFNYDKIVSSLERDGAKKEVNEDSVKEQMRGGKKYARIFMVVFKKFMKKYNKHGLDKTHLVFKKANLDITKKQVKDMRERFEKVKKETGKDFDYYIIYE